jgi:subtilisin family serine protease
MSKRGLTAVVILLLFVGVVVAGSSSARPTSGTTAAASGRYLVIAKSSADYSGMHSDLSAAGAKVVLSMPAINTDVVVTSGAASELAVSSHIESVVPDRIETIVPPDLKQDLFGPSQTRYRVTGKGAHTTIVKDPGCQLNGLCWTLNRIEASRAWQTTTGDPDVLVGVADTGLDYTHVDLADQVVKVEDFTLTEDPPICDPTDQELAQQLGAPASDLDFNGHGSWIGGNIAGEVNDTGVNGIAPGIKLVSLKISGWCGSAYDSELLDAFIWAADHSLDVVSISFGGYLDRSDPAQNAIYKLYVDSVNYAKKQGTVIVAAAGNEHTRIDTGGKVVSHGILSLPPGGDDLFGLYELPGGVPGVVDVASTGRIVKAPSAHCPQDAIDAGSFTWCKPSSDAHQPFGVGKLNQLTYYSNYGPRITVAGPGGARKFNVPAADRGGTPGWPYTGVNSLFDGTSVSDGYNAWEDFSITSNWAQSIPCFMFDNQPEFQPDQCYSTIQGTSMATPHASAVMALMISAHPGLRHRVPTLIKRLRNTAEKITGNETPGVSATDTSPADLTGAPCPGGYCHLGGPAIPDSEAYGAGLVNAENAVK